MLRSTQWRGLGLATAATMFAASPAFAERPTDRYWIDGAGMFSSADSKLRVDRTNGSLGTEVDLEDDINLSRHDNLPYGLAAARIGKNWRIEFEYLRLSREGSGSLDRTIVVGDTTYDAQGNIGGLLQSTTYRVGAGYSFIHNDTAELGGSLGVHITRFKTQIVGVGTVNGTSSAVANETRAVTAPLPTLGLYGTYVLSPLFHINGRIDYLKIKIDNISGKLIDAQATVGARVLRNVSVGGGYRYVEYGVGATGDNFTGRIDYKFWGPIIFAELAF